jgi:hypothetical protein
MKITQTQYRQLIGRHYDAYQSRHHREARRNGEVQPSLDFAMQPRAAFVWTVFQRRDPLTASPTFDGKPIKPIGADKPLLLAAKRWVTASRSSAIDADAMRGPIVTHHHLRH